MARTSLLWVIFLLSLIAALTAGCRKNEVSSSDLAVTDIKLTPGAIPPTIPPYVFATSRPGYASVHGQLAVMSPLTVLPKPDGIYLVPVEDVITAPAAIPAFVEGEVPQADVDERTGEFVVPNVEPIRYILVVTTVNGVNVPARTMDMASLVLVDVKQTDINGVIELGMIRVP